MSINGDYSQPVSVNGYECRNCTDVANAKKNIDPAHPKSGPFGIDAKDDPTVKQKQADVVTFGGSLSPLNGTGSDSTQSDSETLLDGQTMPGKTGTQLDITA